MLSTDILLAYHSTYVKFNKLASSSCASYAPENSKQTFVFEESGEAERGRVAADAVFLIGNSSCSSLLLLNRRRWVVLLTAIVAVGSRI